MPEEVARTTQIDIPVTVLFSGGIDSTACLFFYKASGTRVNALFIDYGQPAARYERQAAVSIASECGVPLGTVECSGIRADPTGDVPGRNGFLYFLAAVHGGSRPRLIATGIHEGTRFYDCSSRFVQSIDTVVGEHAEGRIRFVAPFVGWSKAMILRFCEERAVPIHLSRSCDSGSVTPCGVCLSCLDRANLS